MKANAKKPYRFSARTRTSKEQEYWSKLEESFLSSSYSVAERLMNFPLYVPRQNITTFLCKYEIFKRVLSLQGSIIECGVLFGGGLMTFAQLSAIFEPTNHQRRVIGFDTFAGLPTIAPQDVGSASEEAHKGGLAVDSFEEITKCAQLYDMNRFVGHLPKIELIRGDAEKTISEYLKNNPHLVVSLLYLDFDVYAPTKVALESFLPRMPKGTILAFDELNLRSWPGETVAALDVLTMNRLRLERFSFGSTVSFAEIE